MYQFSKSSCLEKVIYIEKDILLAVNFIVKLHLSILIFSIVYNYLKLNIHFFVFIFIALISTEYSDFRKTKDARCIFNKLKYSLDRISKFSPQCIHSVLLYVYFLYLYTSTSLYILLIFYAWEKYPALLGDYFALNIKHAVLCIL